MKSALCRSNLVKSRLSRMFDRVDTVRNWPSIMSDQVCPCHRDSFFEYQSRPYTVLPPDKIVSRDLVTADAGVKLLFYASQEARETLSTLSSRTVDNLENAAVLLKASTKLLNATGAFSDLSQAFQMEPKSFYSANIRMIHRAFLTTISECLNHRDSLRQSQEQKVQQLSFTMIDSSIELAQRAHELSLPLHLPLYQKLMEALLFRYEDEREDEAYQLAPRIIRISSWAAAVLDTPIDSNFFRSTLCRLADQGRFDQVYNLYLAMSDLRAIYEWDLPTTLDVFIHLNAALRKGDIGQVRSQAESLYRVISFLDENLIELMVREDENELPGVIKPYIDQLSREEFSELVDALNRCWRPSVWNRGERSVHNSLRESLLSMVNLLRSADGNEGDDDDDSNVELVASIVDKESNKTLKTVVFTSKESDMLAKTKERLSEFIYTADALSLPDVVDQLEKANGGKRPRYSKLFEEMLCEREFEEMLQGEVSDDEDYSEYGSEDEDDDDDDDD